MKTLLKSRTPSHSYLEARTPSHSYLEARTPSHPYLEARTPSGGLDTHAFYLKFISSFIAIIFFASNSSAYGRLTSTGEFLREERGAEISAYGGAGTAIPGDLFAMQANPASVASINRFQTAFEYDRLILDVNSSYLALGGAWKELFSWGVWFGGIDYGSTLRTTVNDPFGSSNSTFTGSDIALGAVVGGDVGYDREFHWGVGIKYYRFAIDRYSAGGVAGDLGVQWDGVTFGENQLRFGVSLLNAGSSATFLNESEDLPLSWRFGSFLTGKMYRMGYEGLLEYVGGRGDPSHARVGVGISPVKWLTLRIGANTSREFSQGVSTGFGVSWNDLKFDYAYLPYGDLGARNKVSLAYSWGKPMVEESREESMSRSASPVASPVASRSASPAASRSASPVATPAASPAAVSTAPRPTAIPPYSRPVSSPPTVPPPAMSPASEQKINEAQRSEASRAPEQIQIKTVSEKIDEYISSGNRLVSLGKYDEAIKNYADALSLDPRDSRVLYNLATAQMLAKRYSDAVRSYTQVTLINPKDAESFLYLGVCHFNSGRNDLAKESWKKTLELDPDNETAKNYLNILGI